MNDLDLRTALHRDADLVGAPSPDLLEQLGERRDRQRHRRMGGVAAAVLGVVVIAAGIPLGQSLVSRSDSAPASRPDVDPLPSPSLSVPVTPVAPSTPAVSPTSPGSSAPAVSSSALPPAPSAPAGSAATTRSAAASVVSDAPVACPSIATLAAALPADTADRWYTMPAESASVVCSGTWAAAGYSEHVSFPADGGVPGQTDVYEDGQAGLFHLVDGRWTQLDRTSHCDDAGVPADVWESGCNVD